MVTTTAREENDEFFIAIGRVTKTAGTLTQLVKGARSYTGLIGFDPRRPKALKGDELPRNRPSVYTKSSTYTGREKLQL